MDRGVTEMGEKVELGVWGGLGCSKGSRESVKPKRADGYRSPWFMEMSGSEM